MSSTFFFKYFYRLAWSSPQSSYAKIPCVHLYSFPVPTPSPGNHSSFCLYRWDFSGHFVQKESWTMGSFGLVHIARIWSAYQFTPLERKKDGGRVVHPFLLMNSIPLCGYTTASLSVPLLMGIEVVSATWLLWKMLGSLYMSLYGACFHSLGYIPWNRTAGPYGHFMFNIWSNCLFSQVAAPFYILATVYEGPD